MTRARTPALQALSQLSTAIHLVSLSSSNSISLTVPAAWKIVPCVYLTMARYKGTITPKLPGT